MSEVLNTRDLSQYYNISPASLNKLCRACMADLGNLESIPITNEYNMEYKNIIEMIYFCTSLQISPLDGLPAQICLKCVQKASVACLFKKQCQNSQESFMQIIAHNDQKTRSCHCDKVFLNNDDVKFHSTVEHKSDFTLSKQHLPTWDGEDITRDQNFENKFELERLVIDHKDLKHDFKVPISDCNTFDNICETSPLDSLKSDNWERDFVDEIEDHPEIPRSQQIEKHACNLCPKIFTRKSYLINHKKRHANNLKRNLHKPHVCEHCSAGFCKTSSLAVHIRTKHTKERIFKCDKCDKTYTVNRDLNRHLKTHTDTYKCHICDKVFAFRQTLRLHLRAHGRSGDLICCSQCDQHFKDERLLERHVKITHSGESHECLHCDKTFSHLSKLRTHLKSHNAYAEKRLQCQYCPKRFNFVHHWRNHERTHTGAKPFLCNKCGRGFTQSHYLTVHMKQHDDIRPYPCAHCDKSFCQPQRLQRHLRIHTGEKPFMCSACGKRFASNTTLERHLESHKSNSASESNDENKRPGKRTPKNSATRITAAKQENSVCRVCNEVFADQGALTAHMRGHMRAHRCTECGEGFTLASTLQAHEKMHQNTRQHHCGFCDRRFSRPEHLKCHVRRAHSEDRPHVCTICKRGFFQSGELTIHMRRHTGDFPYQCTKCNKSFPTSSALKIHIRSHTGEKPYVCAICSRAFTTSSSLSCHMNTHTAKTASVALTGKDTESTEGQPTHSQDEQNDCNAITYTVANLAIPEVEKSIDESLGIRSLTVLNGYNDPTPTPILQENALYSDDRAVIVDYDPDVNVIGANVDVQMVDAINIRGVYDPC